MSSSAIDAEFQCVDCGEVKERGYVLFPATDAKKAVCRYVDCNNLHSRVMRLKKNCGDLVEGYKTLDKASHQKFMKDFAN